ncbi:unnamed protein product [Amaranthus hypochondriacus]
MSCKVSEALWVALKQYKERVKVMQLDIDILTENLRYGRAQHMAMKEELIYLKSQASCHKQVLRVVRCSSGGPNSKEVHVDNPDLEEESRSASMDEEVPKPQGIGPADVSKICTIIVDSGCSMEGSNSVDVNPDLKGRNQSASLNDEFPELQGSEPLGDSKVHVGDVSSVSKWGLAVDESIDSDSIMTRCSDDTSFASTDVKMSFPESFQALQSSVECRLSHDMREYDCHEKDQMKECDKESKDAFDGFPRPHGIDLMDQSGSLGCDVQNEMDKENVAHGPGSNLDSELEAKETFYSVASKAISCHDMVKEHGATGQRSSLNIELEKKEASDSKPMKAERPKRRLMPASSLLLRDAGNLDVTDDNLKLQASRSARKAVEDEYKRSKGSASLLRLLKNHLPR